MTALTRLTAIELGKIQVDDIASRLCIDRQRVFAAGMSNGGYMSHRLACEASDTFAAVAPVAEALTAGQHRQGHPQPLPVVVQPGGGGPLQPAVQLLLFPADPDLLQFCQVAQAQVEDRLRLRLGSTGG